MGRRGLGHPGSRCLPRASSRTSPALIERGRRGVSRSCTPSHSWAAWPTFLTGRDPAGHGVFDILEHQPGASRRMPVSSRSILAPTWPERLSAAGRRVVIANIPLTYPPPDVNGALRSPAA